MGKSAKTLLVDPELVLPKEGCELDLDFWDRLVALLELKELAACGPKTKEMLDDFLFEWYEAACLEVGLSLSGPDIPNLINELFNLSVLPQKSGSWRKAVVDIDSYCPVMGRESNRSTLESDVNSTHVTRVLVYRGAWPAFDEDTIHELASLSIVDFGVGLEACARALLRRWPSYSLISSIAPLAFPQLLFCEETWSHEGRIKRLEREYSDLIVGCLTVLNDYALQFWRNTVTASQREKLLKSKCKKVWGVGPENNETMKDRKCAKERTFSYDKHKVSMSWHYKFRGRTGRLYFKVDDDNGKIYVGLITDHLTIISSS